MVEILHLYTFITTRKYGLTFFLFLFFFSVQQTTSHESIRLKNYWKICNPV